MPGNVFQVHQFMVQFYSFKAELFNRKSIFEYSEKAPYNHNFEEMGYLTTNFIPMQYWPVVIVIMLTILSFILNLIIRTTQMLYKKPCCRITGMALPA